ncbi:MAG: hydroxyacid dehydrogenase, partial [Propionibacteriaceae bacterium]|nr:hydroxyacid dehydrogenase [Propionibacteriaceae bacterium]
MILGVALDPALRTAFFTPRDWARLEALADIRLLPQPDDCVAPANRAVLSVAEGLLTGWGCPPLTPALLDWCPALKLLVHTGGSVRAFVGPAVYARGILVASQTERNAEPVAEFCLAQILLAAKGVGRASRAYATTAIPIPY